MSIKYKTRKLYWLLTSKYTAWKNPINKNLTYFGVTGTDGKTTTSSFLYEVAKANGYKPLMLTTVSAKFEGKVIDANLKSSSFFSYSLKNAISGFLNLNLSRAFKNLLFLDKKGFEETVEQHRTTPLAGEIRRLINEYEKKGADFFILETTSHALDQYRVYGIEYDVAIYTNITNDHLDYHGNWENYAKAKAKLIHQLKPNGIVVLNKDDKKSYEFLSKVVDESKSNLKKISYFAKEFKKINSKEFFVEKNDTEVYALPKETKTSAKAELKLFGDHNIYNSLAAVSSFYAFKSKNGNKVKLKPIVESLANLQNIIGRMEFVSEKPKIIIDFAHTPNGTLKALESAKKLVKRNGKLWVVFGCAGFRDRSKRPVIGKIAYDNADNIMITADDPRTEDLHKINDQIIEGFKNTDEQFTIQSFYPELKYEKSESKYIVRFDEPNANSRRNAIAFAIKNANDNDVVILLGKAHETSLAIGHDEIDWNEFEEARKAILAREGK